MSAPCFGDPITNVKTNVRNSPSTACTEQLRQFITEPGMWREWIGANVEGTNCTCVDVPSPEKISRMNQGAAWMSTRWVVMPTLKQESSCPFPTDIEVGHNLQTRDKDCMRGRISECGHGDRVQFHLASGGCEFEITHRVERTGPCNMSCIHYYIQRYKQRYERPVRRSQVFLGIPCHGLLQTVASRVT